MSKEPTKATRYTCDNPKCDTVLTVDDDYPEEAYGFHGTVSHVRGEGSYGGDWYACKIACIKPAIMARIE